MTARLSSTCSSWPRSARTRASGGRGLDAQLDVLADDAPEHRRDPVHHLAEIEHGRLEHLLAAEREQLVRQVRRAVRRLDDLVQIVRRSAVLIGAHQRELRVAGDDGDEIVEVVRDAAGERADGLELLRLAELRLALAQRLLDARALADLVGEHDVRRASSAVRSSSSRRLPASESISWLNDSLSVRTSSASLVGVEPSLPLFRRRAGAHVADERLERTEHRSRDERRAERGDEHRERAVEEELRRSGRVSAATRA